MKKILFLVVAILLAIEFRDHPVLKPYTDKLISIVSTTARGTVGVSDFPQFISDFSKLKSTLAQHEYDFLVEELTDAKKVEAFYSKQCSNIDLSHVALTGYSIKKACEVINDYLPSP